MVPKALQTLAILIHSLHVKRDIIYKMVSLLRKSKRNMVYMTELQSVSRS